MLPSLRPLLNCKHFNQISFFRLISSLPTNTPELDLEYICNPNNSNEIKDDMSRRPNAYQGNLDKVLELNRQLQTQYNQHEINQTKKKLIEEAIKLPNRTCPTVRNLEKPKIIEMVGRKPEFKVTANFPASLEETSKKPVISSCKQLLRTDKIGKVTGPRTYYLTDALAKLEQALVNFTLKKLIAKGFDVVSVPDLIHPSIVNACGLNTEGERSQVFTINPNICLSGTAEMPLVASYANTIQQIGHLPLKVATVSRCYRYEDTKVAKERGLFRVRNFTKVEMFGITANETTEEGNDLLNEFLSIQKELFTELGLNFQVLEMPPADLGPPAYKKIDIEAWMPGREIYGEISSASNCTTYQSRRFAIKYEDCRNQTKHCQTVNGTACAVPRMLIALAETYQTPSGSVVLPDSLVPFMDGLKEIKEKKLPKLKWINLKI